MRRTPHVARFAAAVIALLAVVPMDAVADAHSCGVNHYILGLPCPSVMPGAIDPAFTGSWYDPAQSGQGLSIQILPNFRILVFWFAFNPEGTQQIWLVGSGTYAGDTATITSVEMPTGGRWIPNFDPDQVVNNVWGTLTLTFTDADHGRVDFNSTLGYGAGSMNLTRLTLPEARWQPTGKLVTEHGDYTATSLPDGRVLVAGGANGSAVLDTTELYDPGTGKWTSAGHLARPRIGHTATLLPGGKVLVVGGDCNANAHTLGCEGTAELYDPATGSGVATGKLNTPRIGFTATLLATGKVLVAGGVDNADDSLSSAELYDPGTGTWSYTGDLVTARLEHSATALADGRVLIAGGWLDDFFQTTTGTAEIYDPVTGTWSGTGSLHHAGLLHTATRLGDGRVLVAGGYKSDPPTGSGHYIPTSFDRAELYDPVTGVWTVTGSLNHARDSHTATLLPNGKVLVAGGDDSNSGRPLASAELFDPSSGTWTEAESFDAALSIHTATLLMNGDVLIVGEGYFHTQSADLYHDPGSLGASATGAWFDPTQPGHGLLLEALPGNRLLAEWFAFNPEGTQQAWFVGLGSYSGNTATISTVVQPTGGRWTPNLDPARIVDNPWGTLTFTFSDCNHGKVDFTSTRGYGSGSMDLTRLTQPAGFACP